MDQPQSLMDKIAKFTKGREMSVTELSQICSSIAQSIAYGTPIKLEYFDGYMHLKKMVNTVDRVDSASALKQLSWLLAERVATMPDSEKAELDRIQKVLASAK